MIAIWYPAVSEWSMHPMRIGSDQALLIALAEAMLNGRLLYTQIHEINPPLIIYVNVIPTLLARALHLTPAHGLMLMICGLLAFGIISSAFLYFFYSVISTDKNDYEDESRFFVFPLIIAYASFNAIQQLDMGQREHLVCIAYFPLFLLRYYRYTHPKHKDSLSMCILAVLIGLISAIGIYFKHYFVLMALIPELVMMARAVGGWPSVPRQLRRPECWTIFIVGLVYFLHFFFLPQQVFTDFFYFIFPLVKAGYGYYTCSSMTLLAWRGEFIAMALLMALAWPLGRRCSLIAPMAAFTLTSFAVYLVANQDWSYHMTPVRFGIYLLAALQLATVIKTIISSQLPLNWQRWISAVAILYLVLAPAYKKLEDLREDKKYYNYTFLDEYGQWGSGPIEDVDQWMAAVVKYTDVNDRVIFMDTGIAPGYPAILMTHRRPGSRYFHSMTMIMLRHVVWEKEDLSPEDRAYYKGFLDRIMREYGEDVDKYHPALIVVEKPMVKEVLEAYDFFKKHMRAYKKVTDVENFEYYQYQGVDQAQGGKP